MIDLFLTSLDDDAVRLASPRSLAGVARLRVVVPPPCTPLQRQSQRRSASYIAVANSHEQRSAHAHAPRGSCLILQLHAQLRTLVDASQNSKLAIVSRWIDIDRAVYNLNENVWKI